MFREHFHNRINVFIMGTLAKRSQNICLLAGVSFPTKKQVFSFVYLWMVLPWRSWMTLRDRDVCMCVFASETVSVYQPKRRWVVKWLCIPDGLCPLAVLYSWDSMSTYKWIKGQNQRHCSWNPTEKLLFTAWVHIYLDLNKARNWLRCLSWSGPGSTIKMLLKKEKSQMTLFRFSLDGNEMI